MKISIIGTGYVGLVTGTCLAEAGNDVTCVDIDQAKVEQLQQGEITIFEPGLAELVRRNVAEGRLSFTTSYEQAIPHAQCVFIAVGTPQSHDGRADLRYVEAAACEFAPLLSDGTVVIVKSTVPPGTNRQVSRWVCERTDADVMFASNPEFLKEGAAIDDFTTPDRVVVGTDDERAEVVLRTLYEPFLAEDRPFVAMGIESAEMTKYVANCLLATKISFINEMANLCERTSADINDVRQGIGHDRRIGFEFLVPGVGYGGSCFPKDVRAMISVAEDRGGEAGLLRAVDEVNDAQKHVLGRKLAAVYAGNLAGRKIAIWGLAFKPRTDDIREAPALTLIDELLTAGAQIQVHDPEAMENVRKLYGEKLTYCDHRDDALVQADALVIVTEWQEYRTPNLAVMRERMANRVIIDGRNALNGEQMEQSGFRYFGVGLGKYQPQSIDHPLHTCEAHS